MDVVAAEYQPSNGESPGALVDRPNKEVRKTELPHVLEQDWPVALRAARLAYRDFILSCHRGSGEFALAAAADASPYAACFALFGLHLLGELELLAQQDRNNVRRSAEMLRRMRLEAGLPPDSKPFRQLLAFTLSTYHFNGLLKNDPLEDLVIEQIHYALSEQLAVHCCLQGQAGSGNQAMFLAIFLIHGRDYLGLDTQPLIDAWVEAHLRRMNRFGFWGPDRGMTHLQFQNGYHQHEILEYLGVKNPRQEETLAAVRGLADREGHFAPYPGGGGCYDYDAVFMLTPEGRIPDEETRELLCRTAATIASEQQQDGGFAESLHVRPRSMGNVIRFAAHIGGAIGNGPLFIERLRYGLTLQRPKHNRIHTHWSRYSRSWDESDLWDSWFRMLTLARIDVALHPEHADQWGFIDFPGIGYHPSLRTKKQAT